MIRNEQGDWFWEDKSTNFPRDSRLPIDRSWTDEECAGTQADKGAANEDTGIKMSNDKNFNRSIGRAASAGITRSSISLGGGGQQAQSAPESGAKGNRPVAGGPSGYGPTKRGQVTKPGEANGVALNGPSQQPMVNSFADTSVGQGAKSRG